LKSVTIAMQATASQLNHLQAGSDHRAMDNSSNARDQEISDKKKQLEEGM
jgi:hypothetical protein